MKDLYQLKKALAQNALAIDSHPLTLAFEQEEIKKNGGMKYSQTVVSRHCSNFTMVTWGKGIQKRVDKHRSFLAQKKYADAMREDKTSYGSCKRNSVS